MLKKICFFSFLFVTCLVSGFSQQLTRIAVIDMSRVYNQFFSESRAVRDFQANYNRVQSEIERMQNELRSIDSRRADAILQNNQNLVASLTAELTRKAEDLRIYHQAKTAELDAQRRNLAQSDSFMAEINNELRLLAESEGITTIFDLSQTVGIVWYSPVVDYTDRLITRLRSRIN